MKFGLKPHHWEILQEKCLAPLKQQKCEVWVFGSRARGEHQRFSDIDILFKKSALISETEVSLIKENLENSNLPIKVDLVHEGDLADSYKDQIMAERVRV